MEQRIVLTVCNGNIHRSVIAEICLNRELRKLGLGNGFTCTSRGIAKRSKQRNMMDFPEEWALTEPILKELGIIVPSDQQAQQIDSSVVEEAVVILAMDRQVLCILWEKFPLHAFKMRLFSELVGRCEDIVDCRGDLNPEHHRQANLRINEIAINGISFLCELAGLFSIKESN